MMGLGEDSVLAKNYPELTAIFKSSIEKAKSFENYLNCYVNDPNMPFTITHGDSHERQCIWSIEKQSAVIFDYEFISFGPPVMDICYLWALLQLNYDFDEGSMLQHYHKKLTSFGDKVTAETYSYEQLCKDFGRMYISKNTHLIVLINKHMPGDIANKLAAVADKIVKKYGITPENVEPFYMFF